MLEIWDNPFIPIEERLEIAAGSVKFWKESWQNQLNKKEVAQAELALANAKIKQLEARYTRCLKELQVATYELARFG